MPEERPGSIPALTVYQPYASLIALNAKKIETREWATDYRGPLLIHAAQKWTREQQEIAFQKPFLSVLYPTGWLLSTAPRGKVIAIATLTDCKPTGEWGEKREVPIRPSLFMQTWENASWLSELSEQESQFGDYGAERFGWFLEDIRPLQPFSLRGRQRLWHVPLSILPDEVREYVNG